ncbi:MAG: O-antigen ligase family protein [Patescibacteria group bacterium]
MKTNNILKYLIYGGLFLMPFIPLIISSSMYFPFITGKNFAFRILAEIIIGLWAVLAVRDSKYRPKFSLISWSVLIFVAIIALADTFGVSPYKSFWSNYERMEGLVTLLHLLGLFFAVSSVLKTEKMWSRFFHTSIGVSVILGIYGLFQLSGAIAINQGGVRVDGTLGNATYLAIYMLFHIFLTFFFMVKRHYGKGEGRFFSDYINYIYGAIIALQAVMLYYTASRGPILGLMGGVLISSILIAVFERERKGIRIASFATLAAIVIIGGSFMTFRDSNFVRNSKVLARFSDITVSERTTRSRFMIWNMAYQGFKERPALGWGQENFNYVFNKYYNPKMYDQEQWFDRTHNVFFDWLVAGGALGILSYLSIFFAVIYSLWKRNGSNLSIAEESILTGLLVGYFFQNLFVFDNVTSYILFFVVIAYAHSRKVSQSDNIPVKKSVETNSPIFRWVVVPIIGALTLFSFYFFNYKGYSASRALIQAMMPYSDGVGKNLEFFKKALAYGSFGDSEIREQLVQSSVRIATSDASPENKQAFFDFTVDQMKKQLTRTPDDARYHLFTGSMFTAFRQYDQGLKGLQKASELSPKKQSIRFEIIGNLINSGKTAEALKLAKETFELETSSNQSRVIYAVATIYAKDEKLADELLTPIQGTDFIDDRVVSAYAFAKRYGKIIPIIQARINKDPSNVQNHISLAAAYLGNSQREAAVAEIQKIIEINPQFKTQGEFYIKEIRAGRNP